MTLDRDLQRTILLQLREAYPELVHFQTLGVAKHPDFHPNAFYLTAHGLIEPVALRRDVMGTPSQVFTGRITAAGLDFLQDDGGLSAILGTVTVRLEPQTIRALLEARIDESALPASDKARLKSKLASLAGKAAEKVFWKLFDELLKHHEILVGVMKAIDQ